MVTFICLYFTGDLEGFVDLAQFPPTLKRNSKSNSSATMEWCLSFNHIKVFILKLFAAFNYDIESKLKLKNPRIICNLNMQETGHKNWKHKGETSRQMYW